jgi:hypothetical protein
MPDAWLETRIAGGKDVCISGARRPSLAVFDVLRSSSSRVLRAAAATRVQLRRWRLPVVGAQQIAVRLPVAGARRPAVLRLRAVEVRQRWVGSSPCASPACSLGFAIAVAAAAARDGDGARGTDFYWAQLPSRTSFASGGRRHGCLLPSCRHGSAGRHMSMVVELPGSPVVVNYFMVCKFSSESLAWSSIAGDDGAMGILFLLEGITVRSSTYNLQGQIRMKIKEPTH